MKEIKYIIHAFLLLSAILILSIGFKNVFVDLQNDPDSRVTAIDNTKSVSNIYVKGKQLFMAKCGSCHILNMDAVGPSLCDFENRGPWSERESVYQWIKNPEEFITKNEYAKELKKSYSGRIMSSFPTLTNEEIDEIINYINNACSTPVPQAIIAQQLIISPLASQPIFYKNHFVKATDHVYHVQLSFPFVKQ